MTDRPVSDTEPHRLDPDTEALDLAQPEVPGAPRVPTDLSTKPPEPILYEDPELRDDPMRHAPKWIANVHSRLASVFDRLQAMEEQLRVLALALDVDAGIPALRRGLVEDLATALAKYVNPLLEDNAVVKQQLKDMDERLRIVEGQVAELRRRNP